MIPHPFNSLGTSLSKENGTAQYPFLIKNEFDFVAFRNAIHNGNEFDGVYHKLMNDLDLSGITFGYDGMYRGYFDGNFKVIRNFSQTRNSYGGLFYNIGGGIKNLGVENINIDTHTASSNISVGGLSAYNTGIIEGCYITGSIKPPVATSGGIVGRNYGIIRNCFTNVIITGTGTYYGGITGAIYPNGSVDKCIALGNVTSTNSFIGGIIGGNQTPFILSNCVASMSSINGSQAYRINGNSPTGGTNNYALNTMLVKGVTVTGTATSANGANATIQQLKSLAFYRDTMGWDMDNIWEIDDGNDFPKLRGF